MYTSHFGLREPPFSITPDPRYLYMSQRHREALAHLLYGTGAAGGFVQLTGEVGTGKTTLCRCLLEQVLPEVDVALILNPRVTDLELLATVCDELGIAYPPGTTSLKQLVDLLYRYLLDAHARGRRTVLVIDEAQNLSPEVLEQIRLLTNLETAKDKLLQIILIGQPELIRLLDRPELRQVAQRVTARYHLLPFSEPDTHAYVKHRLGVAGQRLAIFTPAALRQVHRLSGGIPRLINVICDRALLGAYSMDQHRVGALTVRRAAREVLGRPPSGVRRALRRGAQVALLGTAAAAVLVVVTSGQIRDLPGRGAPAPDQPPVASSPEPPPVAELPPADATDGVAPLAGDRRPASAPSLTATLAAAGGPREKAEPTLAAVLSQPGARADKVAAFGALYGLWGVKYSGSGGGLACDHGRPAGLRCLFGTGGWAKLRRFNLPAIIELVAPGGKPRYATVTALDEGTATLDFGGRRLTVAAETVEEFWDGPFILLWRPPALGTLSIRPGMRGKDVVWLRQALAEIDGRPAGGPDRDLYDDALRSRVLAFQGSRSLVTDGIVGEQTLAHLAAARDPNIPVLSAIGP